MTQRILMSADGFGFGPVSKAVTVATYLNRTSTDTELWFVGKNSAYMLANENKELFNKVIQSDPASVLNRTNRFDGVIDVNQGKAIAAGVANGVPGFMIDSLFGFWKWDDPKRVIDEFGRIDPSAVMGSYGEVSYHEKRLVGHILAEKSFVQMSGMSHTRDDIETTQIDGVQTVPPLINKLYRSDSKEDTIVINLCGQLSPRVSLGEAVEYAEVLLSVFQPSLEEFSDKRVLIAGNREVLDELETKYETMAMGQRKMLKTLNRSLFTIVPPSSTSIYEAAFYDVPVVIGLEQHEEHWIRYQKLSRSAQNSREVFPRVMVTPHHKEIAEDELEDKAADVSAPMYDLYEEINAGRNQKLLSELQEDAMIISKLSDSETRDYLVTAQRPHILSEGTDRQSGGKIAAEEIIVSLE